MASVQVPWSTFKRVYPLRPPLSSSCTVLKPVGGERTMFCLVVSQQNKHLFQAFCFFISTEMASLRTQPWSVVTSVVSAWGSWTISHDTCLRKRSWQSEHLTFVIATINLNKNKGIFNWKMFVPEFLGTFIGCCIRYFSEDARSARCANKSLVTRKNSPPNCLYFQY